jgi:hypothetical protein
MDSPLLPDFFMFLICVALSIFLWDIVLPYAKKQLKPEHQMNVKYFLMLVSLLLFGLAVHCGYDVASSVFNFNDPL